jgi:hypothetical protein
LAIVSSAIINTGVQVALSFPGAHYFGVVLLDCSSIFSFLGGATYCVP